MNLQEIGLAIALNRKKLKITQLNLAKNAGISRVTLSHIETGSINEIGINKIILLCDLVSLNLNVEYRNTRPTLPELLRENERERTRNRNS